MTSNLTHTLQLIKLLPVQAFIAGVIIKLNRFALCMLLCGTISSPTSIVYIIRKRFVCCTFNDEVKCIFNLFLRVGQTRPSRFV